MSTRELAQTLIDKLDGSTLDERVIRVGLVRFLHYTYSSQTLSHFT